MRYTRQNFYHRLHYHALKLKNFSKMYTIANGNLILTSICQKSRAHGICLPGIRQKPYIVKNDWSWRLLDLKGVTSQQDMIRQNVTSSNLINKSHREDVSEIHRSLQGGMLMITSETFKVRVACTIPVIYQNIESPAKKEVTKWAMSVWQQARSRLSP